jgi:hypothetical protein
MIPGSGRCLPERPPVGICDEVHVVGRLSLPGSCLRCEAPTEFELLSCDEATDLPGGVPVYGRFSKPGIGGLGTRTLRPVRVLHVLPIDASRTLRIGRRVVEPACPACGVPETLLHGRVPAVRSDHGFRLDGKRLRFDGGWWLEGRRMP